MPDPSMNGEGRPWKRIWLFRLVLLLAVGMVAAVGWAAVRFAAAVPAPTADPTLVALATALGHTATPSQVPTASPLPATATRAPTQTSPLGTLIFDDRAGGHRHLYAFLPGATAAVPVTTGDWDDQDPAISPDGTRVAFVSNRDGAWDLYVLWLATGELVRLTDTPGYEGHPTWSPDSRWLAYEAYDDGDFDIWIIPADGSQAPLQLTNHAAMDLSPAWDPGGRRIAFASDRDGQMDIFLADLDRPDQRFLNLTRTPDLEEREPAFSPEGQRLAFSRRAGGLDRVVVLDLAAGAERILEGQGRRPFWSPDGRSLGAVFETPYEAQVVSLALDRQGGAPLVLPNARRVGRVAWSEAALPGELFLGSRPTGNDTQAPAEVVARSERVNLVPLEDIRAPNPVLAEPVVEAFVALRERVAQEAGWDFLGTLDYAFVGLNDPLPPGFAYNDWLYTGRAFAFSQAAMEAGLVEVVREDFAGETYWRVFVRALRQDGSQGQPLRERPWDFSARFRGDPVAYDQGGALKESVPTGYYVDFTELAADYGFQRVPALPNWRTFYPGARFNEFVKRDGLDWLSAMLQLYPASAIATPTPFRTPTPTPTRTPVPTPTPWWWRWRTPTPSPVVLPTATATP